MFIFNPLMSYRQAIIQAIKSWKQVTVLSGSYAVDSSDLFGFSVAINSIGNKIVVGAYADEVSPNTNTGLAYTFISSSSGWKQESVLSGSYAVNTNDRFGISVAMNFSGSKVIIGAQLDEIGSSVDTGLAYIFASSSTGWKQEGVLSASYAQDLDYVARTVAMNSAGDKIVIGAYLDELAGGSNFNSGLIYVFNSSSIGWKEEKILTGSKAIDNNDYFGISVAINSNGNKIVVGSQFDEINSTTNNGLVYVFDSSSVGWVEEKILSGSYAIDTSDNFGYSVAINSNGSRIVVGATNDETGSTINTGLVYVFDSSSLGWIQNKVLTGSYSIDTGDNYGYSVAINSYGDKILVGAYADETGSTLSTGVVYVFDSSSVGWVEEKILFGNYATDASDAFGISVAINSIGDKIVAGAYNDEISLNTNNGLAYIFEK